MSNTPSLLPCPFCGGINIIHCGHHMYCHACGADGPDADSQHESEARSAWNRRTPQPVVREPLSDAQIAEMMRDTWGCASIAPRHAMGFARAIEAEVRKQDDALIQQLVEALEYHRAQTRPIELADEAITAGRARLGRPHD